MNNSFPSGESITQWWPGPERQIAFPEHQAVLVRLIADRAAVQVEFPVVLETFRRPEHGARPIVVVALIDRPAVTPAHQVPAGPAIKAVARPRRAVEVVR